eukprot:193152_1
MGTETSKLNDSSYTQPSATPTTIETTSSIPSLIPVHSYSTAPITPILNYNYSSYALKSSLKNNNNGITGIYVSEKIAKIMVHFWRENIDILTMQDQLEIGCSIFFGMTTIDKEAKKILKSKLNNDQVKIEYLSLKFLDNFAYLTRNLLRKDVNLYLSLSALGNTHRNMGITIKQFNSMLISIHETFLYYFPKQYTAQVKYAVDKVFTVAARIIADEELNKITIKSSNNVAFLESLDACLSSSVGREYLFEYFHAKSCNEIVKFLQLLSKMQLQTTDKGKYIVARDIVKRCILPNGINHSMTNKNVKQILESMQKLEKWYLMKKDFKFEVKLFSDAEYDVYKSIMQNYWSDFVFNVEHMMNNNDRMFE